MLLFRESYLIGWVRRNLAIKPAVIITVVFSVYLMSFAESPSLLASKANYDRIGVIFPISVDQIFDSHDYLKSGGCKQYMKAIMIRIVVQLMIDSYLVCYFAYLKLLCYDQLLIYKAIVNDPIQNVNTSMVKFEQQDL